jgi:hypothetical protein
LPHSRINMLLPRKLAVAPLDIFAMTANGICYIPTGQKLARRQPGLQEVSTSKIV